MARTPKRTTKKDWRPKFLKEMARSGNVSKSCIKAKIGRTSAYAARNEQPEFAAAWKEAEEIAVELMEAEAHRRAVDGTLKPVFQGKQLVGRVREYSDTLLIFLLKARRPGVYRDNSRVVVAGDPSAPFKHEIAVSATAEDVALARAILGTAAGPVHPHGGPEPVAEAPQTPPEAANVPPARR